MAKSASKRGEHNQEERMVEVAFWIVPATGRAHLQVFCEQTIGPLQNLAPSSLLNWHLGHFILSLL